MIKKIGLIAPLLKDILAFISNKLYSPKHNEKVLLVNFENPQLYHRFFYLMLKFYQLSGYTIHYPMSFSKFRNLRNKDRYLGLIVREKHFLSINKQKFSKHAITIDDGMFSSDYFDNYFKKNNSEDNSFHIPMSFHPFMYHHGIWNNKVTTDKNRANAIFCYGNFDSKAYLEIKKTYFKSVPRTELLQFFKDKFNIISIASKEEILDKKPSSYDKKIVFAIKEQYAIKMENVRELLSYFNFYLCCPGVVMPLCHNVIEAMSVGTIPLIQKEYADVMYPHLEHNVNAIIFNDLSHLETIMTKEIFTIPEERISILKKNVLEYYNKNLSPESVVTKINDSIKNKKRIYLQAEHRSVKFIK